MAQTENFFAEFPPISKEEWIAKITADLKGAPFDKKLIWKCPEGFEVWPFYRREDISDLTTPKVLPNEFPYVRSTKLNNEWFVRQSVNEATPEAANKRALHILYRGVDSLEFSMQDKWINCETLEVLLKDIAVEAIELHFSCCISKAVVMLETLKQFAQKHNIPAEHFRGSIGYIPFKRELYKGRVTPNWKAEAVNVLKAAQGLPNMRVLVVNATFLSNAGAYISEELGYALAWGAELLDTLSEEGFSIEEVASRILFSFGIGPNFFMEIAKFRAARWLWATIVAAHGEQYKGDVAKIKQHATTSTWNLTLYDAHVNMLRTQTETMSAALGGVDSITVLPFDVTFAAPDDFSTRIARNQQLLLKEESHFDKVIDPAAGSYYVEALTEKIAQEAWKLFVATQEAGGFAQEVQNGNIQRSINATNSKRHDAVAKRKESLLGTNEFPNFTERAAEKIKPMAKGHHCSVDHSKEGTVQALNFSRGASDFEALRLSTERAERQPVVFMLTIGNLAMRLARSQFAGNFFGCAGYKLIDNLGFDTVQDGVNAALEKKADIVVLCSSDDEYATYAPEAYQLLKGKATFVVAGNPACRAELEAEGIEHFIHVKSNVLETLQQMQQQFNINA